MRRLTPAIPLVILLLLAFAGRGPLPAQDSPFDIPEDMAVDPFEAPEVPDEDDPFETDREVVPLATPVNGVAPEEGRSVTPQRPEGPEPRGLHVRALRLGFQTEGQIDDLLRHFRASSFNRLYADARTPHGLSYLGGQEPAIHTLDEENGNPLRTIRHQLDGEETLHAVISVFPSLQAAAASRPPEDSPVARHPEIVNRTIGGNQTAPDGAVHLDPGHPETLDYLTGMVREIAREVEPHGVLLTGVQYPGKDWGYSEGAVQAFRTVVGGEGPPPVDDPTWSAWRRAKLAETLDALRTVIREELPDAKVAVLITTDGMPPRTWNQWLESPAYAEKMQDWIQWCREGLVDEIVFEVHERHTPQRATIGNWVHFANTNSSDVAPIVSLSGERNTLQGLEVQFQQVRGRGAGTILHSYDRPVRGPLRGFYDGFGKLAFRSPWGRPVPGYALHGDPEDRHFALMPAPPPRAEPPRPALPFDEGREERERLVFRTPTPTPSPTPDRVVLDDEVLRQVTLANGNVVEVYVLEATSDRITVRAPGGSPMVLSRTAVREIEPPL